MAAPCCYFAPGVNRCAIRSSTNISSNVAATRIMVSVAPLAMLPRSVRLKIVTGSVVQLGG